MTAHQGEAQVSEGVQQHVGGYRGIGRAVGVVLVQVRAEIEVGETDIGQRGAVVELAKGHDVLELGPVTVPRILVAGAIVFPLVAAVEVGRQVDPRMGVDVGAQAAEEGIGAVGAVAAVVVDPVEGYVPLLERADGQAASGQVVDGDPRLMLHEQR